MWAQVPGLPILEMRVIGRNEALVRTLEQARLVVACMPALEFRQADDDDRCAWIEQVPQRFACRQPSSLTPTGAASCSASKRPV